MSTYPIALSGGPGRLNGLLPERGVNRHLREHRLDKEKPKEQDPDQASFLPDICNQALLPAPSISPAAPPSSHAPSS